MPHFVPRLTTISIILLALCAAGAEPLRGTGQSPGYRHENPTGIDLSLRGWLTSIDGDTTIIRDMLGGKLELSDELGLRDDTVPGVRLRWQFLPRHAAVAEYARLSYRGNEIITRPFLFNYDPVGLFSRVESRARLHTGRLGWRWTALGGRPDMYSLDTIVDVGIYDVKGSFKNYWLTNPFFPEREERWSGTIPIPLLGVAGRARPHENLEIFGELSGMYAGSYGEIIDTEAGIRALLGEHFTIEAGYRYLEVDAEFSTSRRTPLGMPTLGTIRDIIWDDDETARMRISGPFVGVGIRY